MTDGVSKSPDEIRDDLQRARGIMAEFIGYTYGVDSRHKKEIDALLHRNAMQAETITQLTVIVQSMSKKRHARSLFDHLYMWFFQTPVYAED